MSSFEWMELQTLIGDIETARSRLADARKRRDQGRIRALEEEITRAEKQRLQLLTHISTSIASAPEPDPPPKARGGADSRQATAPVSGAVQDEADAEQPLPELASTAEPAPSPEASEGTDSREASAPVAEAVQDEADAEQPLPEPTGAAEPAPPARAREGADSRRASARAAEALSDEASGEQLLPDPVDRIVASGAASPTPALKAGSVEGGIIVWDQLTPSDIERAKNELDVRRAEVLARHAEELKGLDAEQSQLETLEQAIDIFLRRFNQSSPESGVVKLDQERELRQQGNV